MRRYLMGNVDGTARVRSSRPGYDAEDLTLDPRFVSFDSSWRSALRWYAGGIAPGNTLSGSVITQNWIGSFGSGTYLHKIIDIPGIARSSHTAIVLALHTSGLWYQCAAMIETDRLRVCPYMANIGTAGVLNQFTYYYWVFSVGSTEFDPTEDNLSNSMLFGNHPTRGAGLFISRRGTDVLTATDDDLVLSTQKNYFQFYETGTATRGVQFSANNQLINITLAGSYPDRPPIVAWRSNTGTVSPVYAAWVNDNTISIRLAFTTTTAVTYRWGLIACDPTYSGGVGTIRKRRLHMSDDFGIGVTKKNVGFDEAGQSDWIFRSDRMPLQFRDYSTIYPNTFSPGLYDYPVDAQASAGTPFTIFQMNLNSSSWVGLGWVSTIAVREPGTSPTPREWLTLLSATETQYRVQKDGSVSFSGIASYAGVANVADF
ncbi:hypothetical protein [Ancylobacter sp. FA202]|uniref:hypothetical protein n=1 Tax=Ancylobacter sp. FA202 TaxID=1111106 RepID=UPI0003998ACF|nr:hypothetical protein [Ancylobacter sp. FA202]